MSAARQRELADLDIWGELVRLRPVRRADAAYAYPRIAGRPAILRWLVWGGPASEDELADSYAHWARTSDVGANYQLAIEALDSGRFAGTISLRFADHPFVGDVGYWLAEEVWGRGYATEANRLAAHLGFRHLGASALVAEVFLGNDASARVLEKVGYRRGARSDLLALAALPDEDEHPRWQYTLARTAFEREHRLWRPAAERVELAP